MLCLCRLSVLSYTALVYSVNIFLWTPLPSRHHADTPRMWSSRRQSLVSKLKGACNCELLLSSWWVGPANWAFFFFFFNSEFIWCSTIPQVHGESNNKHQDLQSRGEGKFCVKEWRDGTERWAEKEVNRQMERPQDSQTGLESWHCMGGGCISGTHAGTQRVGGFQREEAGGRWILFRSRSAGLESKEAGRGESRDWWEEKVYKKLFLVVKVKNQGLQRSLHTEGNKRPRVKTSIQNQT